MDRSLGVPIDRTATDEANKRHVIYFARTKGRRWCIDQDRYSTCLNPEAGLGVARLRIMEKSHDVEYVRDTWIGFLGGCNIRFCLVAGLGYYLVLVLSYRTNDQRDGLVIEG